MKCRKGYKVKEGKCVKTSSNHVKTFISKRFTLKNILILLAVIVALVIMALLFKHYFLSIAYLPTVTKGFTQYEGTACGTYQCSYIYGKLLTSNIAEFNTGANQWKVVNSGGGWGSCGADSQGYIVGGCCTTTEVYKNGVLIDTIKQGYGGTSSNQNTAYSTRMYCEDGSIDSCPAGIIGIGVYPDRWGSTVNGECNNRQNDYVITLPNGTFSIETTSDKNAYQVGDVIFFSANIVDNLFPTKVKVRLNYEVPTIFGASTRTEEKEVDVVRGNNLINFSLAITEPSRIIKVTPELEVEYATANVKGVNFNYPDGLQPITYKDYFPLGSVQSPPLELNITQQAPAEQNKTCMSYGCPVGYTCQIDGTCLKNKSSLWVWILISAIVLIILIALIILAIKMRKRGQYGS